MNNNDLNISNNLKLHIVRDLIEPAYKTDIEDMIYGKRCWKMLGHSFETMSQLFVAIGCIFSFSSGFYKNPTLSFISGSISTISLAMLQISSFAYKENKKQTYELNILLEKLNIDTIPDINIDSDRDTD
jgi:hypothetical protein